MAKILICLTEANQIPQPGDHLGAADTEVAGASQNDNDDDNEIPGDNDDNDNLDDDDGGEKDVSVLK